jgi:hypothetical protein
MPSILGAVASSGSAAPPAAGPSLRGYSQAASSTTVGSLDITLPSGIADNDTIILVASAGSSSRTFTWPSGYTEQDRVAQTGTGIATAWATKTAVAADASAVRTVTLSTSGVFMALGCVVLVGGTVDDSVGLYATGGGLTIDTWTSPAPGITPSGHTEVSICAMAPSTSGPNTTDLSVAGEGGIVQVVEAMTSGASGSNVALGMAYDTVVASPGGSRSWTSEKPGNANLGTVLVS